LPAVHMRAAHVLCSTFDQDSSQAIPTIQAPINRGEQPPSDHTSPSLSSQNSLGLLYFLQLLSLFPAIFLPSIFLFCPLQQTAHLFLFCRKTARRN
jgi:hypothetical protein